MAEKEVSLITDYLRDTVADIVDDFYQKQKNYSSEEQTDYIIDFLTEIHKDDKKYFENYGDFLIEEMYPYYKQLIIRLMITDFYEYQTLIRKRGRQSELMAKHHEFIIKNMDQPDFLVRKFIEKSNMEFNRAIVDNYIIYIEEKPAFCAQAIKEQINNHSLSKLNKINPFYICEVWHFFDLNKITEAEEINNELLQLYYDEYDNYIREQAIPNYEDDNEDIEEINDGEDTCICFSENSPFDETIDYDDDTINEMIIGAEVEDSIDEAEETLIGRLTKLRILQSFLVEGKKKLWDVISYMIGNVYENIIYEEAIEGNLHQLKKEIYTRIDEAELENVIKLFISDDDFSTLVLDFFVEYNEWCDKNEFERKRNFIETSPYKAKIKKYNKHYEEENSKIEGL